MADLNLQMALLQGLPTRCTMSSGNYTRLDNVLMSSSLCPALICCTTVPEEQLARSDHMPIVMALSAAPKIQTESPRPNYRGVDWEVVRAEMVLRLEELEAGEDIRTVTEFNAWLGNLIHIVSEVIDATVPKSKVAPYQKWWWSKEL